MAIDTNVQTFTDAELLALCRRAIAKILLGQSFSENGRTWTSADLPSLLETKALLEAAVSGGDEYGTTALVVRGER